MTTMNTSIRFESRTALSATQAEVIILPVTMEQVKQAKVHEELDQLLPVLTAQGLFEGKLNQIYTLPVSGKLAMLVGLGQAELRQDLLRNALQAAGKALAKLKVSRIACIVSTVLTTALSAKVCAHAMTEGLLYGTYRMKKYHREQPKVQSLSEVIYLYDGAEGETAKAWAEGALTGQVYAEATNAARDLVNLPGNVLVPSTLAEEAMKLAKDYDLEAHVLDEQQIVDKGMGGLWSIGKGSVNPPRMIVLKYQGKPEWTDAVGLVGKGITFDTGGISLKKGPGMEEMIADMGGAAAVLGVMKAIGELRPAMNVIAVIASAENMPAGNATKPGDLITTMSGRTIEMLNTDAEGRVVLADAMTYAKQLGAAKLIDVATLTGAVGVVLADVASGAVTNDEEFLKTLMDAAKKMGEKVWQLPAYDEFWDMIKSDVADVRNRTGPQGAASTAGVFIGTFADGLPWIHLDIAGTAFNTHEKGIGMKGGTGVMVRTLTELLLS